ncbi:hypothetical protein HXZ94_00285 [Empedobacter falsenii]|uniref:hypothetical protein n=1 Tax=Empedobacter falsenii TaxID=343874 RepID=UPI0025764447|nr:hypothetical protein [Empedobacter falsenii]MDM1296941.1 hypothetical protein [Empedobacter falsenii]MDM1316734.1 hypothetical protein [Empedobacter falsenii]
MVKLYFFILFFIISSITLSAQTNLDKGDFLVYAVNSNVNSSCASNYYNSIEFVDEVFILTLKEILPNTIIYLTDNGWQRKYNDYFGTTEGVIKLTMKTGFSIDKGQVFSIKIPKSYTEANLNSINPNWQIVKVTNGGFKVALVDQLFIFNNGYWSMETTEDHKGLFENSKLITAYNNKLEWHSYLDLTSAETTNSGLPGDEIDDNITIKDFHLTINLHTYYNYYSGYTTELSSSEWKLRLLNPINWSTAGSCSNFQSIVTTEKLAINDLIKEFEVCKNENLILKVDENSIVKYQWFENNLPSNENGILINGATNSTYIPSTSIASDKYYYCELKYTLKWISAGISRENISVLKSILYKVKVLEEPKITSIEMN